MSNLVDAKLPILHFAKTVVSPITLRHHSDQFSDKRVLILTFCSTLLPTNHTIRVIRLHHKVYTVRK